MQQSTTNMCYINETFGMEQKNLAKKVTTVCMIFAVQCLYQFL
jgi:hypothetical protein